MRVSVDYLMGRTETKNHPNTALDELHLSDGAIDVLRDGKFNKRLLSEMICHPDFQRMMLDTEIYVDRIADMRINDMNTVLEAVQAHEKSDQSARKSDHDPRPGETKEAVNGNRMRRWGGLYIPLLPFPARRILFFKNPAFVPPVEPQNPPVLLPQKSVCQPLSARTADGEASPFPASAGSKGITH